MRAAEPAGEAPLHEARRTEEGAEAGMKPPPRVVLDTNVVLSASLFGSGPTARVRAGWQSARFVPLASAATAHELVRVLAYPKFGLSAAEQAELLADFMPWVGAVDIPDPPPAGAALPRSVRRGLPSPRHRRPARALVSGDRDLLALAGAPGLCPILGVDAFCRQYLGD